MSVLGEQEKVNISLPTSSSEPSKLGGGLELYVSWNTD